MSQSFAEIEARRMLAPKANKVISSSQTVFKANKLSSVFTSLVNNKQIRISVASVAETAREHEQNFIPLELCSALGVITSPLN